MAGVRADGVSVELKPRRICDSVAHSQLTSTLGKEETRMARGGYGSVPHESGNSLDFPAAIPCDGGSNPLVRSLLFSQEASWTNPHEAAAGAGGGGGSAGAAAGGDGSGGGDQETLSQPEDGRAKWTECLDEASGATYYYNVITVSFSRALRSAQHR